MDRPNTTMLFQILAARTESFYTACSPELEVITYGECLDEAVNNLRDEVRIRDQAAGKGSHAH